MTEADVKSIAMSGWISENNDMFKRIVATSKHVGMDIIKFSVRPLILVFKDGSRMDRVGQKYILRHMNMVYTYGSYDHNSYSFLSVLGTDKIKKVAFMVEKLIEKKLPAV